MNEAKKMSLWKYIPGMAIKVKKVLLYAMSNVQARVEPKEEEQQPRRFQIKKTITLFDSKRVQHTTCLDKAQLWEVRYLRTMWKNWFIWETYSVGK